MDGSPASQRANKRKAHLLSVLDLYAGGDARAGNGVAQSPSVSSAIVPGGSLGGGAVTSSFSARYSMEGASGNGNGNGHAPSFQSYQRHGNGSGSGYANNSARVHASGHGIISGNGVGAIGGGKLGDIGPLPKRRRAPLDHARAAHKAITADAPMSEAER